MIEEMQYTGVRLTAEECVEHKIVKKACPMDELMEEAMAFAGTLNKDSELIAKMKLETHEETIKVIDAAIAGLSH